MENDVISIYNKALAVIIGIFSSLFGTMDELFIMLMILMVIDIVSGVMKSVYTKTISSEKFHFGGIRKVAIFLVVIVATQLEFYMLESVPLRSITIGYYIINEGLSFIENISEFVDLPKEFIKYFEKGDDLDE